MNTKQLTVSAPAAPDIVQYPADRCKTIGQVFADRLRMFTKTIKLEERLVLVNEVHRAVFEILSIAGSLYKEQHLSKVEFEDIYAAYREFEQSYDGVDIHLIIDGGK